MAALQDCTIFGRTSEGFLFKLVGAGTDSNYQMAIECTNNTQAYVGKFNLAALIDAVDEEGIRLPPKEMLEWLHKAFDGPGEGVSLYPSGGSGVVLKAEYRSKELAVPLTLPPNGALATAGDAHTVESIGRSFMEAQFSEIRCLQKRLHDCTQRMSAAQQVAAVADFLAAMDDDGCTTAHLHPAAAATAAAAAEAAAAGSPTASKRKEVTSAPASGSAVKAARQDGQASHQHAAVAPDGAAGGSQQQQQPSGTGVSQQSKGASVSTFGRAPTTQRTVAGRGRGRAIGPRKGNPNALAIGAAKKP